MREIKLRYILEMNGELKVVFIDLDRLERSNELYHLFVQGWKIKDRHLFTGLFDRQGKEIYEGDIVQYEGEYFREIADIVWYGTGSWGLHDREKYLDELIFSQAIRYDSFSGKPIYTEVEVIGNQFENMKEKP